MKKYQAEKAILLGVKVGKETWRECKLSLKELEGLAYTSGAIIVDTLKQELKMLNRPSFFGKGKILEIKEIIEKTQADLVIVDFDLSPAQNRNLEKDLEIKVVDRTGLILDIFALRARSKEGKMQVALAQAVYMLPRLVGAWSHFGKSGGGIGTRGPGETQLEEDRRVVRNKIASIRKDLEKITETRHLHRAKRESQPIPIVSLVGYTNAGKSTLLNRLTHAGVLSEDKLFATLDPTLRKFRLPSGREILFADTVGFIRKLPHELVEAFKSTFEEVSRSTLLVQVVDVSNPYWRDQMKTVRSVLKDLALDKKRMIIAYNKCDLMPGFKRKNGAMISALHGQGADDFISMIEDKLCTREKKLDFTVPYEKGETVNWVYRVGSVSSREDLSQGVRLVASLSSKFRKILKADPDIEIHGLIA